MLFVHLKNNETSRKVINDLMKLDKDLEVVDYGIYVSVKSSVVFAWVSDTFGVYYINFNKPNHWDIVSYILAEVVETLYTC